MSTDSEREIRDRLGGALDTIEPGSAPVGTIIRRGKTIRIRRRAGIAVVAAGVVGIGAVLPGVIQHPRPSKTSYHVSVKPPRIDGQRLVFSGAINSRKWRFTLHFSGHNLIQSGPGDMRNEGAASGPGGDPANLDGFAQGRLEGILGPVSRDVAFLTMRLPNGTVLRLQPVSWHGARWVGAVAPVRLGMGLITAYSRNGTEIAHSTSFRGFEYVRWLDPGQRGLARHKVVIGSGTVDGKRWSQTAYSGPWGLCIHDIGTGNDFCDPPSGKLALGDLIGMQSCDSGPLALVIAQAAPTVRSLRLRFSDGSVQRVPVRSIVGRHYFAYAIPANARFTGWTAYGAAGQRLGSGAGIGTC